MPIFSFPAAFAAEAGARDLGLANQTCSWLRANQELRTRAAGTCQSSWSPRDALQWQERPAALRGGGGRDSLTGPKWLSTEWIPRIANANARGTRQVSEPHEPGQGMEGAVWTQGLVSSHMDTYHSVPAICTHVETEALHFQLKFFKRNGNSEFYVNLMGNQLKHTN